VWKDRKESWISSCDIRCGQGKVGALMISTVASPGRSFMDDLVKASTPSWGVISPCPPGVGAALESPTAAVSFVGFASPRSGALFLLRLGLALQCHRAGVELELHSFTCYSYPHTMLQTGGYQKAMGWNCCAHVCQAHTSSGGRRDVPRTASTQCEATTWKARRRFHDPTPAASAKRLSCQAFA
jgi:hypothetical protein